MRVGQLIDALKGLPYGSFISFDDDKPVSSVTITQDSDTLKFHVYLSDVNPNERGDK